MLYIRYMEAGEEVQRGPYCSISPDGFGVVIGQNWTAYQTIDERGKRFRIIIPEKYHSIISA